VTVALAAVAIFELRRETRSIRAVTLREEGQWRAGTNNCAQNEAAAEAVRAEVAKKKDRLKELASHQQISAELLALLEDQGDAAKGHLGAWAELRGQLGIGWDASPDYVLVSKSAIGHLEFKTLVDDRRVTDIASDLLGLSPAEQSALASAVQRVREGQWLRVQRAEPSGDVLAQYTTIAPRPDFMMGFSNSFAGDVIGVLGRERADMLIPQAWRTLINELAPRQSETMTIRRSVVDGEPDLVCEMRRGSQISDSPVRYAIYPSMWFLQTFPGGWQELARRENFELPAKFQPH
jgi:hypothetical protein